MWNGSATSSPRILVLGLLFLAVVPPASAELPRTAGEPEAVAGADPRNDDPRIPIVEQQVERDHPQALAAVEKALAEDPAAARELGSRKRSGIRRSRPV